MSFVIELFCLQIFRFRNKSEAVKTLRFLQPPSLFGVIKLNLCDGLSSFWEYAVLI